VAYASTPKNIDLGSARKPIPAQPLSSITPIEQPRGFLQLAFLTRDQLQYLDVERYIKLTGRSAIRSPACLSSIHTY
jgi:hypothetical protein